MIKIIYISDSNKHFQIAIDEYIKRFWKTIILERVKPTKNWTIQQIIKKDTENINKFLSKQKNSFNILLSLNWQWLNTIQFKNLIQQKINRWENINFIIWWAFWLNENKIENIHYKLSLSKLTFPHWLALLILLEQIYRSFQIIQEKKYHY